jgi:hypothetical protein
VSRVSFFIAMPAATGNLNTRGRKSGSFQAAEFAEEWNEKIA